MLMCHHAIEKRSIKIIADLQKQKEGGRLSKIAIFALAKWAIKRKETAAPLSLVFIDHWRDVKVGLKPRSPRVQKYTQ